MELHIRFIGGVIPALVIGAIAGILGYRMAIRVQARAAAAEWLGRVQ